MAAGGAAAQLSQNIRDQFLQCKICLDGLKEPKTLPCLHTFCAECIICYAEHNIIDGRKFACPICRRHIYIPKNGIEGFPDSFFVESLNDVIEAQRSEGAEASETRANECGICKFKEAESNAVMICVDCKIDLCEECSTSHSKAKVTADHTLLPLGSGPNSSLTRDNFCRVHRGETIKYYCETCNSPICLPCTFLDHKSHEVVEIRSVRQGFAESVSGLVILSQDNILQLEQAREDLSELENELFVRKESAKTDMRRAIQEIIRTLHDQEKKLLKEIEVFFDTLSIARDRQKVERTIYRLQRAHDFAKQLLAPETSPIAQLTNQNDAKDNLAQALAFELPDIMVHSTKLDNYMHFLPGRTDLHLGTLLPSTGATQSNTITHLDRTAPTTRALYLHRLQTGGQGTYNLGEVLNVGILSSGNVVVLVSEGRKIKVFDKRGQMQYDFGDDDELQHPSDFTITRENEIAVTDCGPQCVKVFDSLGTRKHSFSLDAADGFGLPIAITTDGAGRYLVCDQAKSRVTVHRSTGELLHTSPTPELESPQYIASSGDRTYLCDPDSNIIAVYSYKRDAGLQFIIKIAAPASGILACSGICVDPVSGALLISDATQDRVHRVSVQATLSHLVACGRQLLRPTSLATAADGTVAVCQRGVSLDPEVPTTYQVCMYRAMRADVTQDI